MRSKGGGEKKGGKKPQSVGSWCSSKHRWKIPGRMATHSSAAAAPVVVVVVFGCYWCLIEDFYTLKQNKTK